MDENQNGLWDIPETALADINFKGRNGSREASTTGKDGSVLLRNFHSNDWTDISASISGSADPTFRSSTQGVSILARPGVVSEVHLPIITTADIEGDRFHKTR